MTDAAPSAAATPRNAIVVLLDSLNRHMLGAYGGSEFETPNLDRFAESSLRFDRHFSGSLPCMPATHTSTGPGTGPSIRPMIRVAVASISLVAMVTPVPSFELTQFLL